MKSLLTGLLKNSIAITVKIENNEIDRRSGDKVTGNLAKSNNLSNLSNSFVILLTLILKITKLSEVLTSKTLKADNNKVIASSNSNKGNKTVKNMSKFRKLENLTKTA